MLNRYELVILSLFILLFIIQEIQQESPVLISKSKTLVPVRCFVTSRVLMTFIIFIKLIFYSENEARDI